MKTDEYKKIVEYVKGANAPKCANCVHKIKTKGLRCMHPAAQDAIGGFAVKPDAWCVSYKREEPK